LALHSDADRDALITLLKNPRASVRTEAALALGQWGQPAVALALQGLLTDHEPVVVREAARALGRLGNPDSKPPLIAAVPHDKTIAQEWMAWALGELQAAEAVPVLIPLLQAPSELVQAASAEALGKIGDKQSIPPLQQLLVDMTKHGPFARQRAIEALRRLGDRSSLKRVLQIVTDKVVPPPPGTTMWMYDMDDTRVEGVRYLEFLGDPKLADELLANLKDIPSYPLRKIMAATISKLTGKAYLAEFSFMPRHFWMESLEESYGKPLSGTGIVLVQ
jgi:hypothetical protein